MVEAGHEREDRNERTGLKVSAAASSVVGVVAVVWGIAAESQALLLDGVYSTVGTALSLLTLWAARLVAAGPTARYPFGREALGPLMVAVQALVLLGTVLYAGIDALLTLRSGGSDAAVGSALLYAVLSTVFSLGLWVWLLRLKTTSELVDAEAAQWRAGTVLSAMLAIGFGGAVALRRFDADSVVPYVDPALVLLAALMLIPTPVRMLRTSFSELIEATPAADVRDPIVAAVEDVRKDIGLPEPALRISKLGRKLYVQLDFVVESGDWKVGDADRVRRALLDRLSEPGRLLWINAELHDDPNWDTDPDAAAMG